MSTVTAALKTLSALRAASRIATTPAAAKPPPLWTEDEDEHLSKAVSNRCLAGDHRLTLNWESISLPLKSRHSASECHQRYLTLDRSQDAPVIWTEEEDTVLLDHYATHFDNEVWADIAASCPLESKSVDACKARAVALLRSKQLLTAAPFTTEEDAHLLDVADQFASRLANNPHPSIWTDISKALNTSRTPSECLARFAYLKSHDCDTARLVNTVFDNNQTESPPSRDSNCTDHEYLISCINNITLNSFTEESPSSVVDKISTSNMTWAIEEEQMLLSLIEEPIKSGKNSAVPINWSIIAQAVGKSALNCALRYRRLLTVRVEQTNTAKSVVSGTTAKVATNKRKRGDIGDSIDVEVVDLSNSSSAKRSKNMSNAAVSLCSNEVPQGAVKVPLAFQRVAPQAVESIKDIEEDAQYGEEAKKKAKTKQKNNLWTPEEDKAFLDILQKWLPGYAEMSDEMVVKQIPWTYVSGIDLKSTRTVSQLKKRYTELMEIVRSNSAPILT